MAASDFLIRAGTLTVGLNDSNFILVRGDDEQGQPTGIASDVARALASRLGVRLVFQRYASAGALGDAIAARSCDAGFLGAEPLRADRIAFSKPYLDLEAGFILANDSAVDSLQALDRPGVTIAAVARSAYALYLERTLQHARLCLEPTLTQSYELFHREALTAVAGLSAGLHEEARTRPCLRVATGWLPPVGQAIGLPTAHGAALPLVDDLIASMKASGALQSLVRRHALVGVSVSI